LVTIKVKTRYIRDATFTSYSMRAVFISEADLQTFVCIAFVT